MKDLRTKKKIPPPTPLEPKIKLRKDPPCPENSKMSKTGISKRWIETKKNENGKFSITKCVIFNEPTVSTSKKVKKISKVEKLKIIQKEKFKNYFGKSQSASDSDKNKPAPGLEPIPKPGDKINLQPIVKKRKFSSEVYESNASPYKLPNLREQPKPKSVSTIRKMFEQGVTEQQHTGKAIIPTNQKQAFSKAAKFTTKKIK